MHAEPEKGLGETNHQDMEIDVVALAQARRQGHVQLVDVREPEEIAGGVIGGAKTIPLGTLADRLGDLDPTAPTVVVCRSGYRSLLAAEFLRDRGFVGARSLAGGVLAWVEAGHLLDR